MSYLRKLVKTKVWKVFELDFLGEMFSNVLKLAPVCATQCYFLSNKSSLPQIKVDQSDNPQALVTLGPRSSCPASDILPSTEDDRVHGAHDASIQ